MNLLFINGPNLNLVGKREPKIYGSQTLEDIQEELLSLARKLEVKLQFFQSNSEGEMIDCVQKSAGSIDGILMNAGAYTHTSIALRDALLGVDIPYVEVHLSNIYAREEFRHKSFLSDKALGVVCGFGSISYHLALQGIVSYLKRT